jgi:hypothetical protein
VRPNDDGEDLHPRGCKSPKKLRTKKLKPGKHTFSVTATDAAGNTDASAATRKFRVVGD